MRKLNVAASARADIQRILRTSSETFGAGAQARYRALIEQALRDLMANPERAGADRREELPSRLRLYHLRHSRGRTRKPPRQASHFILFRYDEKQVFVLRVLHEAMDIAAHSGSADEMPQRESTAIDDIKYDEKTGQMRVTFTTGRIYVYLDVPMEEYEAFDAAESRGRHFNAHIRDRYEYREVR